MLKSIDNILSVDEDILAESQRLNKSTSRYENLLLVYPELPLFNPDQSFYVILCTNSQFSLHIVGYLT